MALETGLLQTEGIVSEFTRIWGYLGQLGLMATNTINMLNEHHRHQNEHHRLVGEEVSTEKDHSVGGTRSWY